MPFPVRGVGYTLSRETYKYGPRTCISVKTGCPMGLANISPSLNSPVCADAKGAVQCPEGRMLVGFSTCLRCQPGQVLADRGRTKWCKSCPDGSTSLGGLGRVCKKFPTGYQTYNGDICMCEYGWTENEDGVCVKCRPWFSRRPSDCTGTTFLYNY